MRYLISTLILGCLLIGAASANAAGSFSSNSSRDENLAKGLVNARVALDKKDFAGAETVLRKLVASNADSADAWNLLGFATRKQGRRDEAERYYDKALAIDPTHKGALEYLGELYVQAGRMDEAKGLLKRLDAHCMVICDERDELKKAIQTGRVE